MISYRELRTISLDFRRISSNLLNSDYDNADVNMVRFKIFIDETFFINQLIHSVMNGVDYDFKKCFLIEDGGWHSIDIPADEKLHIKAQYDYLTFIVESDKCSVFGQAFRFPHSSNKYTYIIQSFINNAFKPLINYINDAISKEIILLEEEQKQSPSMVQNIGNVYGSAVQGTNVTSTNATNVNDNDNDNDKLFNMLKQAIKVLASIDAPENIKADLQDDIEVVSEQVASTTPKKNRLIKALTGIKKFTAELGMKVAVSTAAGAVTGFDWHNLIQSIETFIDKIK